MAFFRILAFVLSALGGLATHASAATFKLSFFDTGSLTTPVGTGTLTAPVPTAGTPALISDAQAAIGPLNFAFDTAVPLTDFILLVGNEFVTGPTLYEDGLLSTNGRFLNLSTLIFSQPNSPSQVTRSWSMVQYTGGVGTTERTGTFTLALAPVPLPAALPLALSGLAALACIPVLRRHRRAHRA